MVQLAFSLQEKLQELLAPHLLSSVFLKLARGGAGGAFDFRVKTNRVPGRASTDPTFFAGGPIVDPLPMRMVQKLVGPHPQGSLILACFSLAISMENFLIQGFIKPTNASLSLVFPKRHLSQRPPHLISAQIHADWWIKLTSKPSALRRYAAMVVMPTDLCLPDGSKTR